MLKDESWIGCDWLIGARVLLLSQKPQSSLLRLHHSHERVSVCVFVYTLSTPTV